MRRALRSLKNYLIPSKANKYKPSFFTARSVGMILSLVVLCELGFLAQSFLPKNNDFLTAVLPGALVAFSNEARQENNLGALSPNSLLSMAATLKAEDMAKRGYFSHSTPDGQHPWIFLDKVGYDYSYAGENLAVNFVDSKDITDAWMDSPSHRANLLDPHFSQIGIGVSTGTFAGKEAVFVVQFLASPGGEKALLSSVQKEKAILEKATESSVSASVNTIDSLDSPQVKAVRVGPVPIWERVSSSPRFMSEIINIILLVFVTLLFATAVFIKLNAQHVEVWSNGLLMVTVLVGLLLFQNDLFPRGTFVPEGAASVYIGAKQ